MGKQASQKAQGEFAVTTTLYVQKQLHTKQILGVAS